MKKIKIFMNVHLKNEWFQEKSASNSRKLLANKSRLERRREIVAKLKRIVSLKATKIDLR